MPSTTPPSSEAAPSPTRAIPATAPTAASATAHPPSRATQLIAALHLQPHPEGGWYRETYRSPTPVQPGDGRPLRSAMTAIYFLLEAGQLSRWHAVSSDEAWVHLEGAPLDLWQWNGSDDPCQRIVLGPALRQHVVPAGFWQAAEPAHTDTDTDTEIDTGNDGFSLVTCIVAPGFDFDDFRFMAAGDHDALRIARHHPQLSRFI